MIDNDNQEQLHNRDGKLLSPWQRSADPPMRQFSSDSQMLYDCVIVGAGITGATAAVRLQQKAGNILLIDAYTPGYGTTGGTTSHINTFADTTYKDAESAFGEEGAKLFAEAVNEGLNTIRDYTRTFQIACDLEEKQGYIYAEDERQALILEEIIEGNRKFGVHTELTEDIPMPYSFVKAVVLNGQAQFHPIKYLRGILEAYQTAGGKLQTNTLVNAVKSEDGIHILETTAGEIRAKKVIYATHLPPGINVFSFRCAPYRSYAIGVRLNSGNYPDALVYNLREPYHYFRTHEIDGEKILIAGGEDHKTGHADPEESFEKLISYVAEQYDIGSVRYKWSSQYYVPADGLPYVGQIPFYPEGILCATGYNGNGMMLGTISGKILADLVSGVENKYADLFSTSRIKPIDGFKEFVKENADVAYHFIADRLSIEESKSLQDLNPGEGKVVKFDGKKIAAYKDLSGHVHALSPVCTHAACIVNFNNEEKSWDCPCHGARYDIQGNVITGPAQRNLQRFELSGSGELKAE